ncbi:MAG: hypothetical protein QOF45_2272 [Gaiellaceae bacterium]|jgi:hypothetical protein|nr:hypothetical protein [Gaiellaceae bacterium]
MKRFGFLLVVLGFASAAALTTASAGTDATRSVCHRVNSKKTPYAKIRVSAAQLKAHLKHSADIYPVPRAGCPKTLLSPSTGGRLLSVRLRGEAESPAGDPVGTGTATVRLRAGQGQVCYRIAAVNLPPAAAAHIHRGAAGTSGPVIIPLATPNTAGLVGGCATATRALVGSILAAPASFYVNVHTAEFPAGAIRGQLSGDESAELGTSLVRTLVGTSEPNAKGTAVLRFRPDAGQVCYRLRAENVTLPTTAAHIHRGATGVNGPVVVPFNAPGADGSSSGCAPVDAALMSEIMGNWANFYVNVHTKEHPAGAIRAQLA